MYQSWRECSYSSVAGTLIQYLNRPAVLSRSVCSLKSVVLFCTLMNHQSSFPYVSPYYPEDHSVLYSLPSLGLLLWRASYPYATSTEGWGTCSLSCSHMYEKHSASVVVEEASYML
jgi:hypothetical protein